MTQTQLTPPSLGGSPAGSAAVQADIASPPVSVWRECFLLSKPGITRMVVIASAVGFAMAVAWHGLDARSIVLAAIGCLLGTAAASAGANSINQLIEIDRDSKMKRTASRPLPSGRLAVRTGIVFAVSCSILGPLLLGLTSNWVAGGLAAATILLYAFAYTPMKPVSSASTLVGAIPGAMPCLIGWAAASPQPITDLAAFPAWSVFAVLLVWQIPHFLAIAMMYREQYQAAGFKPVPVHSDDSAVAAAVALWAAAAVCASMLPALAMPSIVSWRYGVVAVALGLVFLFPSFKIVLRPDRQGAKRVFLTSIAYLPLVYIALVADGLLWNNVQ